MMDEARNENTKFTTDAHAWRKKPRKFAPKSRLGCKTCKIRRVKCDLSRPSCLKCRSTGRTCDGYGETPLPFNPGPESGHDRNVKANREESCHRYRQCTAIGAYQPEQWHATSDGFIPQSLKPFMILPGAGPAQTEAMCFFEFISIKHLNEYLPCESWRQNLMLFSQTVPAVRHAATALALTHRNYLDHDSADRLQHPWIAGLPDNTPLFHYNKAIQYLLGQKGGDSIETTAVTLLVCYLFTCFDHLAGNYTQAIKHLRGGVQLSRNIKAMLSSNCTYDDAQASGVSTLVSQVTRQIRRLDMQAVTFLVDWTPADIQDILVSQLPPSDSVFRSLEQAADHLYILLAQVMRLRIPGELVFPMGEILPSPSLKDYLSGQLETWSSLFKKMLQEGIYDESDPETYRLILLLRLQHTMTWTLLNSYGPGREMEYDNFLPQFQQCLALASDVAAAHVRYSGPLTPTFSPDIGIVPVLYTIGVKCRHPAVRREVLTILRRQPIREAVWDSISAARVIERVIEIEEGGSPGVETAQSMEEIPAWRRVETMSWIQYPGRTDITYTFCGLEGIHSESLIL